MEQPEPALILVSLLLPWTGFIAGIAIGRWWVIPLAAAAWLIVVLAVHGEGLSQSALGILLFMGGSAAVGVALHWLLFRRKAVMARARADGRRLRNWMRAAAARWRG